MSLRIIALNLKILKLYILEVLKWTAFYKMFKKLKPFETNKKAFNKNKFKD